MLGHVKFGDNVGELYYHTNDTQKAVTDACIAIDMTVWDQVAQVWHDPKFAHIF